VEIIGIYYDEDGQIVGLSVTNRIIISGGGEMLVGFIGLPYFAGIPFRAEYYAGLANAYDFEKMANFE
jgi:hypothetical protein